MKGYIQVYTGNGKGKTTAALGLVLRAVGADLSVFIGQFVKGMTYSELASIRRLGDQVLLQQFGRNAFIKNNIKPVDVEMAQAGLDKCRKAIHGGDYDLVVMDELNVAISYGLITVDEILDLLENKPDAVELVITGRNADPRIMDRADLVTEMKEIKH